MMTLLKENFSLLEYNTFHVAAHARFFAEISSEEQATDFFATGYAAKKTRFVLGGGSNVLFTNDFDGIIIHPVIKGIEKLEEDSEAVVIRVGAGEVWDDLVGYCVKHEWQGIENLSMIPGTVGAGPVQNIGAYGVEVMHYIERAEGFMIDTGKRVTYSARECKFGYRDSIFKNRLKDQVLITHVVFRLRKEPQFHTSYPDLQKELDNYSETTADNIRQAIINIRSAKLPDPQVTGNAGSFFKNPLVNKEKAASLQRFYPAMPGYPQQDGLVKLSAAWLIEQSGWKGKTCGNVATHKRQPLIIINRGDATGEEILHCALKIQKAVMNQFAVKLEMEVNVL
ncbi:MAG: UDP-N-acetylmuramate dehydrogenase [Bacteroidales bacterium]|nr:UDP-N-acetylmuramate dehydrogenase [Bacteroidales bacterium]